MAALDPPPPAKNLVPISPPHAAPGYDTSAKTDLSHSEQELLRKCEDRIQRGVGTFIEVGTALCVIKEQRLYRKTHSSFENYCQQRWHMSRFYAYRLIGAAALVARLDLPEGRQPSTEAQVRPLARVAPAMLPQVWQEVLARASGQAITGKLVREVVAELAPQTAPGPSPGPSRQHTRKRVSDLECLLTALCKAKLFVERGYSQEALHAIEAMETALQSLPVDCVTCCSRQCRQLANPSVLGSSWKAKEHADAAAEVC